LQETTELSIENAVEALMAQEPEVAKAEIIESEVDEVEETEVDEADVEDSDEDADYADDDEDEYESDDEGEIDSEELDDQTETKLYPVKIDGEIVNVTLSDLTKGYGGDQFNQKNMRHNAEQRKVMEEAFNNLNQQRAQIDQYAQKLSQSGLVAKPVSPSRELFTNDPLGYLDADLEYREKMELYQTDQNQLQHNHQEVQKAQAVANQANLQYQQEELKRLVPDFADAKKATKLKNSLIEHGKKRNFTEAELNSVVDARTMHVLHESMLWRQSLEGKSDVKAKLKKARPLMKSGVKKTGESAKSVETKLMSKLKKSGSVKDAAALLFNN